jgi:hypothetical protein
MVNSEQFWNQPIIISPFTVYCLPNAMPSPLGTSRQTGVSHNGQRTTDNGLHQIPQKGGRRCYSSKPIIIDGGFIGVKKVFEMDRI